MFLPKFLRCPKYFRSWQESIHAWCVYFTAKNTCLVLLLFGSVSLLIRTDAKCSHSHVPSYCREQIIIDEQNDVYMLVMRDEYLCDVILPNCKAIIWCNVPEIQLVVPFCFLYEHYSFLLDHFCVYSFLKGLLKSDKKYIFLLLISQDYWN
jgi:hypothetical protein